jgi:predicted TIM-barrel fold metal-dependent hydrolase
VIFDINAYIGKWPHWPVRAVTPDEVAAEMDKWRIDQAAICSTRSLFVHWEDGNCEAERAAATHPERFSAFACLSTRELSHALPRGGYDFEDYVRRGFAGIRLYPQHHSYHPLYESFVGDILQGARDFDLPVLLPLRAMMNWGMPMLELGVIEALVGRYPGNTWILSGINYLHELQLAVSPMRANPNVHLETSCVESFEAIAKLVDLVGAERILFGSGAPLNHGGAALEKILRAHISDAAREMILCGNAERLLTEQESG